MDSGRLPAALVFIDGILVFAEGAAEMVAPVVFGNKVEEFFFSRVECRFEGSSPRIRDRAWWQPGVYVRVEGGVELEILREQAALELTFDLENIDDRGIAIQFHAYI